MEFLFREENLDDLFEKYATIKVTGCISCGNSQFILWAETGPYKSYKCKNCGLIFMNPQLNETGLNDYYSNYIGKRRLNNIKKMEQRKVQYGLDAILIKQFISNGNVLDVGCNGGFFLDVLGGGYNRFGTELDISAVQYAKDNFPVFGENIYNGSLQSAKFSNDKFDLISMRGVIEHILDPEESIREVSRLLKINGYYYVCATPNGDSYSAELYRENWTLFHPVQHLWHFSPENLSLICERHDLKLIWKEFPYLGTPYENVKKDIVKISNYISNKDSSVSPAFFGNMMSLIFQKK